MGYGTSIRDWKLFRTSVYTELLSLLFCVIVGLVVGAIAGVTDLARGPDWPTGEMMGRTTWTNLIIGLPTAFVSGMGVAVGLLDEQTNSLVGVAISASLLPPAVNAGLLWATGAYVRYSYDNANGITAEEFAVGGGISLLLTVANILLIWASTMFMFRLKEVRFVEATPSCVA